VADHVGPWPGPRARTHARDPGCTTEPWPWLVAPVEAGWHRTVAGGPGYWRLDGPARAPAADARPADGHAYRDNRSHEHLDARTLPDAESDCERDSDADGNSVADLDRYDHGGEQDSRRRRNAGRDAITNPHATASRHIY